MKYAFFDFCGTITKNQTADRFVEYVINKLELKNNYQIYICLILKAYKIKLIYKVLSKIYNVHIHRKKLILSQLKGIKKDIIDDISLEYYNELKGEFNDVIIKKIKKLSTTHKIVLVSAGYEPYIKHFVNEYNISMLFTNEFEYDGSNFTGKIKGDDIYGKNKVKIIKKNICDYDYLNSFSYSDCYSDLPILKFSKNGFVISEIHEDWIKKNKLNWIQNV